MLSLGMNDEKHAGELTTRAIALNKKGRFVGDDKAHARRGGGTRALPAGATIQFRAFRSGKDCGRPEATQKDAR